MRLLTLFVLLLVSPIIWAQKVNNLSKVKLKDGSELNVLIIKNLPGDYIKVELPGNQQATIPYAEIISIKQREFSYHANYKRDKGFFWEGTYSFLFGQASEGGSPRAGMELGASYNYRINPLISTGIGVEPMFFFINNESLLVPIFARIKAITSKHRSSPFYTLDAGWAFAGKPVNGVQDVEGGWFLRNTIGMQIGHFSLGIGYQLQKLTRTKESEWWWWNSNGATIVEERLMKNVVFTTGFSF